MKKKIKRTLRYSTLIAIFFVAQLSQNAYAVSDITLAGGNWVVPTIDAADLQSGAGSDLVDTYENTAGVINISDITTPGNYRVDVSKADTTWHANFQLSVKRTGDGSGAGSISNGTTYQQITDTDASFFTGDLDRTTIPLQLQLAGVSVSISPDTYITTVNYTIVEI